MSEVFFNRQATKRHVHGPITNCDLWVRCAPDYSLTSVPGKPLSDAIAWLLVSVDQSETVRIAATRSSQLWPLPMHHSPISVDAHHQPRKGAKDVFMHEKAIWPYSEPKLVQS